VAGGSGAAGAAGAAEAAEAEGFSEKRRTKVRKE